MAYFPVFIDLSGKRCLIVGGGKVAARKAAVLLEYEADVCVVALEVCDRLRQMTGKWEERGYTEADLEGAALVIAATDDEVLNHHIAEQASDRGILVDSATAQADCSFIFPAVVKRGELSVGIMTSGGGPAVSAQLKKEVENILPEQMEERLAFLKETRVILRKKVDSPEERSRIMRKATEAVLTQKQFNGLGPEWLWKELGDTRKPD